MSHTTLHSSLALITLALSSAAFADGKKEPHLDLWIRTDAGSLVIGSITEGTPGEPVDLIARVFAAEIGEDPDFPFSAFEPGFQSLPGRDTAGAVFGFSVPGPLLAWDGSDLLPSDHTMTLDFGPASVSTNTGFVDGFNFTPQSSGLMHIHFDFTLSGPAGDPAPGVYVLPIAFEGVTPLYAPAPTSWIVFNFGTDEENHDAVIDFTEKYLACGIDLTGNGSVDAEDLAALLGAWGTTDAAADLDGNGTVDASDLAELLGAWGFVCTE